MASYIKHIAVALDMCLGVFGGLPYNVTISTFAGLVRDRGDSVRYKWQRRFLIWLANELDAVQENHCKLARIADINRNNAGSIWLHSETPPPAQPKDQ